LLKIILLDGMPSFFTNHKSNCEPVKQKSQAKPLSICEFFRNLFSKTAKLLVKTLFLILTNYSHQFHHFFKIFPLPLPLLPKRAKINLQARHRIKN